MNPTTMEPAVVAADDHRDEGQLCPTFVCRVSGLPTDCIDNMETPRTRELLHRVLALEGQLHAQRQAVSDLIYDRIGCSDDPSVRRQLLKLRRDLFNWRAWPDEKFATLRHHFAQGPGAVVAKYHGRVIERAKALEALQKTYDCELAQIRRQFREGLADADFQKGLLLSSTSLFSQLPRYLKSGDKLNGKLEQTERGLLRYYTRMAMKATPFGRFCTVNEGRLACETSKNAATPISGFGSDPRHKRSVVRINKRLYAVLFRHLRERNTVRQRLCVELNPTLAEEGERFLLLSGTNGREVFQRITHNPVLDLVVAEIMRCPPVELADLMHLLMTHPNIEATEDDVTAYVNGLLGVGFLRVCTGIREQIVDWDLPFKSLLESIDDDHARQAAALLSDLRKAIARYGSGSVDDRISIGDEVRSVAEETFTVLKIPLGAMPNPLLYDDATSDCQVYVSPNAMLSETTNALLEYAREMLTVAWPRAEQATMRAFFEKFYGSNVSRVPLLTFYEDYYREHFKQHLERQQKGHVGRDEDGDDEDDGEEADSYDLSNPFDNDFVRRFHAAIGRLTELVRTTWAADRDAENITIRRADLKHCLRDVPERSLSGLSIAVFSRLVVPSHEGAPLFVLKDGGITAGYGKFFSRFMCVLPASVQASVYARNEMLSNHWLAEICGDADFNANLHPPLLPWEVSYPTGETGAAERQLLCSDIEVSPDPQDQNSLCLIHRVSGQRVVPVDLGFLNPRKRPPLFQLLSRFSPPLNCRVGVPESPDVHAAGLERGGRPQSDSPQDSLRRERHQEAKPTATVVRRPRITYDDRIVLSVQRWLVPGTVIPKLHANESDWEYFVRVNRWRRSIGIPNEVFVRVTPSPVLPQLTARPSEEDGTNSQIPRPTDSVGAVDETAGNGPEATKPAGSNGSGAAPETLKLVADGTKKASGNREDAIKKARPRQSRDFHKPQYIAFSNPLLVKLLAKMTVNLDRFEVTIEERLPSRNGLIRHDGEAFATEFILQCDFPHRNTVYTTGDLEQRADAV